MTKIPTEIPLLMIRLLIWFSMDLSAGCFSPDCCDGLFGWHIRPF